MAYNMEESVFATKYFTKLVVLSQCKDNFRGYSTGERNTLTKSETSCLIQKYELTGSVCNNKKGVDGRHESA
jgi:hypothetical protein